MSAAAQTSGERPSIRSASSTAPTSLKALSWRRIFSYLMPYWGRVSGALVALLISMGLGLTYPLVIVRLLDSVSHTRNVSSLNRVALLLASVFIAQAIFSFVQSYLLAAVGEHVIYDLRTAVYNHLQAQSMGFFVGRRIGELVSRLTNDINQMRSLLTSNMADFLSSVALLVGSLVIIITIDIRLALFTLVVTPLVILVAVVFGSRLQKSGKRVQDDLAASTVVAEEALQGIRLVKGFGREQYEIRRFASATEATLRASIRQALYSSSFAALMLPLAFGSLGAIMWYAGHEVIAGRMSLPMITGFLLYGVMIASSLGKLASLYGQLRAAIGGVQEAFEILDLQPTVQDAANASTMPATLGGITFQNVSFAYEEGALVLQGITLDIRAGEVLALVGPSGAGKSTVFNLIPRFYDPTAGSVQIDGLDLRTITQSSLRAQLAIVPQETILFGGTIRENILYGRLEATEAEMILAAEAANAHEFIMEFSEQYETVVGERGAKLSGGQRQRIAVARAILKNPRILLLDEATSSLDSESEKLVQEALNRLMLGRTTVIIAHRLSTIKDAHRIAVLDGGRITELGSHDELMDLNGLYARMYLTQFRASIEEPLEPWVLAQL